MAPALAADDPENENDGLNVPLEETIW